VVVPPGSYDRHRSDRRAPAALVVADAVRYMSVHSWKQPDSDEHSGTPQGPKPQPAMPGTPSSQAISAGGGRSRIRTWEGVADGFTGSPLPPFPMGTYLRILHFDGREIGALSVWRPYLASCPGQSHVHCRSDPMEYK
jgi:hypothetical protein